MSACPTADVAIVRCSGNFRRWALIGRIRLVEMGPSYLLPGPSCLPFGFLFVMG